MPLAHGVTLLSPAAMFRPLARAFEQLGDPALLGVVLASIVLSALAFGGLIAGSAWGLHHALAGHGWLTWLAGFAGGVVAALSALWLFLPVAVVIASLFLETICAAVERRWYPGLPPRHGASVAAQLWDGVVVGLWLVVLSLAALILAALLPGVGLILGWLVAAWAVGRGLFVAVAMRRMSRAEAEQLYAARRLAVLLQGGILTAIGTVPLLNLLVPVLGPAMMVHVLQGGGHKAETWG